MKPTTTLLRGSFLGEPRAWGDMGAQVDSETGGRIYETLVRETNSRLPAGAVWLPELSEIIGEAGEELTRADFEAAYSAAWDIVLTEY